MAVERPNLYLHALIEKVTGGKFVGIKFTTLDLYNVDPKVSDPQPSPSISGFMNSNLGFSLPVPRLVRASEEEAVRDSDKQ